jgi:hypothetical protein
MRPISDSICGRASRSRGTRSLRLPLPRLDRASPGARRTAGALGAAVARADAALLDAAERQRRHAGGDEALVDAALPLSIASRARCRARRPRPHARVQPVARVVREPERLVGVATAITGTTGRTSPRA